MTPAQPATAVRELASRFPVAGLGITEDRPSRLADRTVLAALLPTCSGDGCGPTLLG